MPHTSLTQAKHEGERAHTHAGYGQRTLLSSQEDLHEAQFCSLHDESHWQSPPSLQAHAFLSHLQPGMMAVCGVGRQGGRIAICGVVRRRNATRLLEAGQRFKVSVCKCLGRCYFGFMFP